MTIAADGISVPESKLAREITELVGDTESPLPFHHSSRVHYWGALTGRRRGLHFDPELLYAGAMLHDMGLTPQHASPDQRFEVDGANTARDFLRSHAIDKQDTQALWRRDGRARHCLFTVHGRRARSRRPDAPALLQRGPWLRAWRGKSPLA